MLVNGWIYFSLYVNFMHFVQGTFKSAEASNLSYATLITVLKVLVYITEIFTFRVQIRQC
jgi:hypothetical protein